MLEKEINLKEMREIIVNDDCPNLKKKIELNINCNINDEKNNSIIFLIIRSKKTKIFELMINKYKSEIYNKTEIIKNITSGKVAIYNIFSIIGAFGSVEMINTLFKIIIEEKKISNTEILKGLLELENKSMLHRNIEINEIFKSVAKFTHEDELQKIVRYLEKSTSELKNKYKPELRKLKENKLLEDHLILKSKYKNEYNDNINKYLQMRSNFEKNNNEELEFYISNFQASIKDIMQKKITTKDLTVSPTSSVKMKAKLFEKINDIIAPKTLPTEEKKNIANSDKAKVLIKPRQENSKGLQK